MQNSLTVVDIFCGAGGLSAGFADAEAKWVGNTRQHFEIVYGLDNDPDAIKTFRAHHFPNQEPERVSQIAKLQNVEDITAETIQEAIKPHKVDVLIGGPNCQGVSAAGLRNPSDSRNTMLKSFIGLVRDLQPNWFVMENVPGLTHANNRELLKAIFQEFADCGDYQVSGEVLLAADYGVPQLRYRLFVIGTNTGAPIRFPLPTRKAMKDDNPATTQGVTYETVANILSDLMDKEPQVLDEKDSTDQVDPLADQIHNHVCIRLSDDNRERIASIRPGQDWRHMPIRLLPERYFATRASDQKGAYGRLLGNWPAYTITNAAYNVTAGPFTHPKHNRSLSVREAARLQSFSDKHVFYGGVLSQYRQVGNAVPPGLAKAVAEAILFCHYQPEEAKNWGTEGRLTLPLLEQVFRKEASFPVMTPRQVHPDFDRRRGAIPGRRPGIQSERDQNPSVWDTDWRALDLDPEDIRRLRLLARQPNNYRAAKRAKAIVQFIERVPKNDIVKVANVSETSVKKWIDNFAEFGLDGWRAYHTSVDRIAAHSTAIVDNMRNAVERIRKIRIEPSNGNEKNLNGKTPKRLYMNDYLLSLIGRFGEKSVTDIVEEVEQHLQNRVGTVYVGDLLAIYDALLDDLQCSLDNP